MRQIYLLFFSLILFNTASAKDDCELVYSTASYALNHAKSALKANNFEHQVYYSEKALESYEKLLKLVKGNTCTNLSEKIENILVDAEKAANPADWDRGRFYSKTVFNSTIELLTELDQQLLTPKA
ncbi:hypothetical protein KCTC52924_03174 [Arenibacter antarcticus]|uniref:HEPN domain-containing protein n=1 Tax=Arenibacter antarcticus TaxID=2040469 RepID=A0ABW5VGC1_9FLAO|nr:hypothetical protein [Arenibacter sp. H213]MCM4166249.1 hypothetical protein [Arenibacter sp. H213]